MEEYEAYTGKYPVIVLANIDVETEVNHASIGSIIFDIISTPYPANIIITCTPDSWSDFDKGMDIFTRVASRLRSCVKLVDKDATL